LLAEYLDNHDRAMEPVFVGREQLFAVVDSAIRNASKGNTGGNAICFHGPPGIGKSAFLSELKKRKTDRLLRSREDQRTLVVPIDPSNIERSGIIQTVKNTLPEQLLPKRKARKAVRPHMKELRHELNLKWWKRISRQAVKKSGTANNIFPWGEIEALTEHARKRGNLTIVLAVDEAQRTKGTDGATGSENCIIANVQLEGSPAGYSGPPVIFLFAGQNDTPRILNASIAPNRFADGNIHPMKKLSHKESVGYVLGMIEHLRLEGNSSEKRRVAEWFADEGANWPHHLRNGVKALALGARVEGERPKRLGDIDYSLVSDEWANARQRYYQSRLSFDALSSVEALDVVHDLLDYLDAANNAIWHRAYVVKKIETLMEDRKCPFPVYDSNEPHGSATRFFNDLLHHGLIGQCEIEHDFWKPPIDSLSGHLQGRRWQPIQPPPVFSPRPPKTSVGPGC